MSKINDGGPAHPVFDSNMGGDLMCTHSGMSLRDYFAANARKNDISMPDSVPGLCEFLGISEDKYDFKTHWPMAVSKARFTFADAMLAERSKS